MQQVVDIIQDAIPPEKRGEGDEIEVPLDELDTFTLRKLQSFVEVRTCLFLLRPLSTSFRSHILSSPDPTINRNIMPRRNLSYRRRMGFKARRKHGGRRALSPLAGPQVKGRHRRS